MDGSRAIRNGVVDPTPVLDISRLTKASGEQGFLGLAFSPDGSHLYVDYTDLTGDSHVDEFAMGANGRADPASQRQILFQKQPFPNHNGGPIVFGPDGYLYIGLGDGGSGGDPQGNGQNLNTLAREDPAHRPEQALGRPRVRHPGRQPVREGRRAPGDLGVRAAQPVAFHVRQGHR